MPGFNLVAGFLLFVLSGAHASELTVQNSSSATDVRTFDYDTCPRGAVFRDQQLTKVKTRSRLECADRCSSTVGCEAFNVCPDDLPGAFTCHLLSDRNPQGCDGLTAAPSSDCRYAAKRCPCQNGGTWNGHYCKCPVEFTGSCCERFIRDCQEAYDNGHTGTGAYRIHPIGAPSPFYVSCSLGGWVPNWTFLRKTNTSFEMDWATAKAGNAHPEDIANTKDYFIGLENLHFLTSQSYYRAKLELKHTGGRINLYYNGFMVGPETSSYTLTYHSVDVSHRGRNGFSPHEPRMFSTRDHDVYGCVTQKGYIGWYGPDCADYSLFADVITWPMTVDQLVEVTSMSLVMYRQHDFHH